MQQAPPVAASDAPPAQATAGASTAQQPPAASTAPRARPMDATARPGSLERYYSTVNTRDTVVCCAPNKVCVVYVRPDHACFADGLITLPSELRNTAYGRLAAWRVSRTQPGGGSGLG